MSRPDRRVRFIARLPGRPRQVDLFPFPTGLTQDDTITFAMDAERLTIKLPGEIEGLLGDAAASQFQRIGRYALLHRLEHFWCGSKEAICRDQSVDSLMRSLEGVVVDEQADPLASIGQVEEDRGLDTFTPQRSPEPFDFAERLRSPRARDDLLNAPFFQLLGELALASPGHVLRAVVGEDLTRLAVGSQRRTQHF